MQSWRIYCLVLHAFEIELGHLCVPTACMFLSHELFVRFAHVVEYSCNTFVFTAITHSVVWIDHKSSIHSPLDGHRVAAINVYFISMHTCETCFYMRHSGRERPGSQMRVSELARQFQVAFKNGCMNLYSHKECIRACIVPQFWQHGVVRLWHWCQSGGCKLAYYGGFRLVFPWFLMRLGVFSCLLAVLVSLFVQVLLCCLFLLIF